ncbi:hypothetical protein Aperf_G00000109363 [Anoplocephala perfoliata]
MAASESIVKRKVTIIGKLFGDYIYRDRKKDPPFTKNLQRNNLYLRLGSVASCKSLISSYAHFLIPCSAESGIIAFTIFYKMLRRVGHIPKFNNTATPSGKESDSKKGNARLEDECSPRSDSPECSHALKGLFAGFLLVILTLVALALFYTYLQRRNYLESMIIFQLIDIVLLSFGIPAVSTALFQMRVLHIGELSEEGVFDDILLLFGLHGILVFNIFLIVPAIMTIEDNELAGFVIISKTVLEVLQAPMQTSLKPTFRRLLFP